MSTSAAWMRRRTRWRFKASIDGSNSSGTVGALRTFTFEDHTPDLAKQAFHLDWVISQGITTGNACIMVAAGGSEGYFMSDDEWRDEVRLAATVADGRVPIIAGVFELSAREAVEEGRVRGAIGVRLRPGRAAALHGPDASRGDRALPAHQRQRRHRDLRLQHAVGDAAAGLRFRRAGLQCVRRA